MPRGYPDTPLWTPAPTRLRGPFGVERPTTPRLVRALAIPAQAEPELWYVHPDPRILHAILGDHSQLVPLAADAHLYHASDEHAPANPAATLLWHAERPHVAEAEALTGNAIVLGGTAPAENGCPRRFIRPANRPPR